MKDILPPLITHDQETVRRPYEPFMAALQSGVLNAENIVRRALTDPIGVVLGNGRVPHHKDAGVVAVGDGDEAFLAVDHVQLVEMDGSSIQIGPSSKDAVNALDGQVRGEGLFTITMPDGLLRIVGVAVDAAKRPWLTDSLRATRTAGGLAIVQFGLDAMDYEVSDVDTESGILTAKPRTKPH